MNKVKFFILSLVSALSLNALALPMMAKVAAATDSKTALCNGSQLELESTKSCDPSTQGNQLTDVIRNIIRIFQTIVALISVFMIIFGGLKYITSGGSTDKVNGAKNTILYAVIGLVIVAIAQVIVTFVLSRFN